MKCKNCGYVTQGDEIHVCEKDYEFCFMENYKKKRRLGSSTLW